MEQQDYARELSAVAAETKARVRRVGRRDRWRRYAGFSLATIIAAITITGMTFALPAAEREKGPNVERGLSPADARKLTKALDRQGQRVEALTASNRQISRKLDEAKAQRSQLVDGLGQAREESSRTRDQLRRLSTDNDDVRDRVTGLRAENAKVLDAVAKLGAPKLDGLTAQLERILETVQTGDKLNGGQLKRLLDELGVLRSDIGGLGQLLKELRSLLSAKDAEPSAES